MSNTSYFNPAFENQYLENEQLDREIFEDGEFGNPEGIHEGIHEGMSMEGLNMEIPEMSYESGESWETSMEGDRFFGGLLRKFAPKIASMVGGALGGPVGSSIARKIATTVLREQEAEFNGEYAGEFVGESEAELEAILKSSGVNMEILGEMAHYAELAAEATNEQEADRFIGAIADLAGQILPGLLGEMQHEGVSHEAIANEGIFEEESDRFLPLLGAALPLLGKAASALMPIAKKLLPQAVRGVSRAVQGIGRSMLRAPMPQRRQAIRALPAIATRTALRTARALPRAATSVGAASPVPVSQIIAGAAAAIVETLASPARLQSAVRRNGYWARQFRVTGTFSVTPMRRRYRR